MVERAVGRGGGVAFLRVLGGLELKDGKGGWNLLVCLYGSLVDYRWWGLVKVGFKDRPV